MLYIYFAINYYDEQLFNVIIKRVNKFKSFDELSNIFSGGDQSYITLTSNTDSNLNRIRLNQLAFEAALDKDYVDIAYHFISSSQVQLTWNMVRKMLAQK